MEFKERYKIDVSEHTEKKGKFNYLSWVYAVKTLQDHDPKATWECKEHETFPDGTMMVYCTVNAFETTRTAFLAVMDNYNKAIKNPNACDINNAKQRCLAKAISLHGIGLYIYAGEDLPPEEAKPEYTQEQQDARQQFYVDMQIAKTKEELDGFAAEAIEALPEEWRDELNDQLDIRYKQIKNDVEIMPPKWNYGTVNAAIADYSNFYKYVQNATSPEQLQEWHERNKLKIEGIASKLTAKKHKEVKGVDTGKFPHERLNDLIKTKLTELSKAPIQEAAE